MLKRKSKGWEKPQLFRGNYRMRQKNGFYRVELIGCIFTKEDL